MSDRDGGGFTVIELLIVVALAGLVVAATYQTLVTNQRTYTVQAARIQGQQTIRAGMDVLFSELRELSVADGDLLSLEPASMTIRTMRGFGLACGTASSADPRVATLRVGRWFSPGDSVLALIDGDPGIATDDRWRSLQVTAVDTTASCGEGGPAQTLTLAGLQAGDRVLPGAPLRTYEQYTYGLYAFDGEPYLGRSAPGGQPQPVVGPLDGASDAPLTFDYLDATGQATADPGRVRQVQVTLRTRADVRDARGRLVRDSMTLRVSARN